MACSPAPRSAARSSITPGGGLKILGNKFNGHLYGYVLNLDTPTFSGTSDLIVQGNSFENMPNAGVLLQQAGTSTEKFQNVQVIGNQISYTRNGVQIVSGGANWIRQIVITDNIIEISQPGAGGGLPTGVGAGIALQSGDYGVIEGNLIYSEGGNVTGISVETPCSGVVVGSQNRIVGCTLDVSLSGTNTAEPVTQQGAITQTTSAAYGTALFYSGVAGVAYTFAKPFLNNPTFTFTPAGIGGIGGILLAVSTTGFTASVIGIVNATAYTMDWTATG